MMLVLACSSSSRLNPQSRNLGRRSRFIAYILGALFAEFVKGAFGR